MRHMAILILIMSLLCIATPVMALPTLQTYIEGATAGSLGPDEETWYSYANPFTLYVIGAYGPNTKNIQGVTLLISVPQGETGTIFFSTTDEMPVLLTMIGQGSASETNPTAAANTNILTDVAGSDGYATINNPTFLPTGLNLNNHYPLQDNVSDFLIFDLFSFDSSESNLKNYSADDGTITADPSAWGEQKEYLVTYTGFTSLHFDAYGLEIEQLGKKKVVTTWENNPGSHDSTAVVPEPGTLLLVGGGLVGIGLYRRRLRKR